MHRNFLRFRPKKKECSQNRSLIALKQTIQKIIQKNFKTPTCSPFGPSKPPPIIANNIKLNLTWNAPKQHWINDRCSFDDRRESRSGVTSAYHNCKKCAAIGLLRYPSRECKHWRIRKNVKLGRMKPQVASAEITKRNHLRLYRMECGGALDT